MSSRKSSIIIAILLLMVIFVVSCSTPSSSPSPTDKPAETPINEETSPEAEEPLEEEKESPETEPVEKDLPVLVKVEELPYTIVPDEEPSFDGSLWGGLTYENTTDYIIVNYAARFTLPVKKENANYMTNFTSLPGEKSPFAHSYYEEDMTADAISYIVITDDFKYLVQYDVKLDRYTVEDASVWLNQKFTKDEVPVTFDEIVLDIVQKPGDEYNPLITEVTFTNNSQLPITGVSLNFLDVVPNRLNSGWSEETVLPGETSLPFEVYAEGEIEILGLDYIVVTDEGDLLIYYNKKLDSYGKLAVSQ